MSSQEIPSQADSMANETPTTTPPAMASNPGTPRRSIIQLNDDPIPEEAPVQEDAMEVDDENDGTISLPLSKIKRIFKMDSDYVGSTQSAVFATGAATELFIQYLTEQASLLAKMEKRKKIMYKDLSTVVATQDSLNFLSDTVPKTVPLREVLQEPTAPAPIEQLEDQPEQTLPEPRRIDITTMLPVSAAPPSNPSVPTPPKKANINDLMG